MPSSPTTKTVSQLQVELTEPVSIKAVDPIPVTLGNVAHVIVDSSPGLAVTGPATNTELRATPLPVSGSFYQATQPVSGSVGVTGTVAVAGTVAVSNLPATQPVSGNFFQATQPVSGPLTDAQMRAVAVPVSGAFFQATQPVSGTFFPATQPISAAALPLPTGAGTEATLALIKAKTDNIDVALSTRAVTGLTDTQLRATALPVSGPFFQATQPVSAATLPLPAGASTEATLALIKAKTDNLDVALSTRSKPADQQHVLVDAAVAVTGTFFQATQPVSVPALTKGVQGANGLTTQDLKDSGRVNVCWTLSRTAAASIAEALLTLTESRDGAAVTTFSSKIITSGKRFRITSLTVSAEAGGTTPAISRCTLRLRVNTAGAVLITSPLQWVTTLSTPASAKSVVNFFQDFPDGMEFLGDGTKQIAFTWESPDWVTTTNIPAMTLTIFGFEY